MPKKNLEKIYKEISQLTGNEKKIILSKLISDIPISSDNKNTTSITDLKGIGKEIWQGIEAQQYINNERNSWE